MLAVLRPTPGSASSAARSPGTSPPWRSMQLLAQADQVLRLGVVEPDAADVGLHALDAERCDRGRRVGDREQHARGGVHALVGGVRREHDRHQQLERRRVQQLGGRGRVCGLQPPEDRGPRRSVHGARMPAGHALSSARPRRRLSGSAGRSCPARDRPPGAAAPCAASASGNSRGDRHLELHRLDGGVEPLELLSAPGWRRSGSGGARRAPWVPGARRSGRPRGRRCAALSMHCSSASPAGEGQHAHRRPSGANARAAAAMSPWRPSTTASAPSRFTRAISSSPETRGEHARAAQLGELHRERADAAGGTVDDERLARASGAAHRRPPGWR